MEVGRSISKEAIELEFLQEEPIQKLNVKECRVQML
jgi:hypothetical protein